MSLNDLTGFQRDLLFVVAGESGANGKEIKHTLEETQDRHLLAGRVYSNLDDLTQEGLVEKGEIDGRTNCYEITENGLERIEDRYQWQTDFVPVDGVGGVTGD
jgi:DNA-binding PadR family transcriptional regulator